MVDEEIIKAHKELLEGAESAVNAFLDDKDIMYKDKIPMIIAVYNSLVTFELNKANWKVQDKQSQKTIKESLGAISNLMGRD